MSNLSLDPIRMLRQKAIARTNDFFSASIDPREPAWASKRAIAEQVRRDGTSTPEFTSEAGLRGLSVHEMAELVLSKPDPAPARELQRQRALIAIESAQSQQSLEDIVNTLTMASFPSRT